LTVIPVPASTYRGAPELRSKVAQRAPSKCSHRSIVFISSTWTPPEPRISRRFAKDVVILTGDANVKLTKEVLPKIHFRKFNRALCLLDPYGLHLDWEVMHLAGQSQAVDMFLNFPVMDMNRNAIWKNPAGIPQDGIERMNRFWGDESWKKIAYVESPQGNLFSPPDLVKQDNGAIAAAFQDRLKNVAGFRYVADPLPMKNSNNAIVYYLFLASQKAVAEKIIGDIFAKYR
jgi:three-Cys-motif partner protein